MPAKRIKTIEAVLIKKIKESGKSRYQIAADTGVDAAVLYRMFSKRTPIELKNANKLAKYFGLELQEVTTSKG